MQVVVHRLSYCSKAIRTKGASFVAEEFESTNRNSILGTVSTVNIRGHLQTIITSTYCDV